jgi:RimJ/RimL family protein N-acetyltransferase
MVETHTTEILISQPPFIVRKVTQNDVPELVDYMRVILNDRMSSIADSDEMVIDENRQRGHLRRIESSTESTALIAVSGGEIIGYLTMEPNQRRKVSHVGEIGMSVRSDWRRRGVGLALLQEAERFARLCGTIEKLALNVFSENIAAIRLYEKAGFFVEGKLRNQIKMDGKYQDLVLMGKML